MATIKEYEALLTKLAQNPDTLPTTILSIRDMINTDLTERDTLQNTLTERDTKIRSLQDTNTELFLRVTGDAKKNENTDPEYGIEQLIEELIPDGKPDN